MKGDDPGDAGVLQFQGTPSLTPSPPPVNQQMPIKNTATSTVGPARLVAIQEPQENFHKDEGGKANQLSFRILLQGELTPDILANAVDGCLPLSVRPIFEDGELADPSVLDIVGGTDGSNPCVQVKTRLGGVRYRLRTVSKRLGNRGIGVICYVVGCPNIDPIRSESTMVFSKRKNKEQRLEEQARERSELLERQRAAQLLLSARASPSASDTPTSSVAGAQPNDGPAAPNMAPSITAPQQPAPGNNAMGSFSGEQTQATVKAPQGAGMLKFPGPSAQLPPQFIPAPAIVRPRPRRPSRDKDHESDSDSDDSGASGKRKRGKYTNGGSNRNYQRQLEDRVAKLEAALAANVKEVEEMRAAMNLCFYQLGGTAGAAGLRRSSSQNVPWEFAEPTPNFDNHSSVRDQLVSSLTLVSPQPTRSPFEIDSWVNGGALNGAEGPPLRLRRDISGGSSQVPSPRSTSAVGLQPPIVPKRSASSESIPGM